MGDFILDAKVIKFLNVRRRKKSDILAEYEIEKEYCCQTIQFEY